MKNLVPKPLNMLKYGYLNKCDTYNKSRCNSIMNKHETYINPFTNFGFKKLFGEESSKGSLISFLNNVLPIEHKITRTTFANSENLGLHADSRKAVFDIS